MLKFAELTEASQEMIEGILEQVDRATLATALQGSSARLIERVLGGRPPEEIAQVLEDVRRQQAVSLEEIEAARQTVTEIAADLERAGIPVHTSEAFAS